MPYKDPEVRKAKAAEYSKNYYEKNKAQVISKQSEKKKLITAKFAEFKAANRCKHCGESHPATLDFHHIERHKSNKKVFQLVKDGHHWPRIMQEVSKCEILCSNCHRKLHHDERIAKKNLHNLENVVT